MKHVIPFIKLGHAVQMMSLQEPVSKTENTILNWVAMFPVTQCFYVENLINCLDFVVV